MLGLLPLIGALLLNGGGNPPSSRPPDDPAAERHSSADERPLAPGRAPFGISFVTDDQPHLPPEAVVDDEGKLPPAIVILVHGLDDPGWMWRDMIPALRDAGHIVARFEYANDGEIAEAADLFALNLQSLFLKGVLQVDIVAHSMGGLVSRDVLTRQSYYNSDGTGGGRFPAIDHLIMCGTPNHGAEIVRLRAVSEIKEQLSRAYAGEGSWDGAIADGTGEAAVDLLPGSDFLSNLNRRKLATHTQHVIITGRMTPVSTDDLTDLTGKVRKFARQVNVPQWLNNWLNSAEREVETLLDETVRGLGDGCVSVDSARLAGVVDFTIVQANHVSLIVNIIPDPDDTPPAIPIVLERLAESVDEDDPRTGGQ